MNQCPQVGCASGNISFLNTTAPVTRIDFTAAALDQDELLRNVKGQGYAGQFQTAPHFQIDARA